MTQVYVDTAVTRLDADAVVGALVRCLKSGSERGEFPLAWVRVVIEAGRLGDQRIFLTCQGERQEIGSFLPLDERLQAAKEMNDRIRPMSAWHHKNFE